MKKKTKKIAKKTVKKVVRQSPTKKISKSKTKWYPPPLKFKPKTYKVESIFVTETNEPISEPQGTTYWQNRLIDDPGRDWRGEAFNWVDQYWQSINHPHRKLVLEALREFSGLGSVLELGCNCGPNLELIHQNFPNVRLVGIDVNPDAVEAAQKLVVRDGVEVKLGNLLNLPIDSQSVDVVLSDAVLIYTSPAEINQALQEINRVARKGIVLIERDAKSKSGEVVGNVWGRDYKFLLESLGFAVVKRKISKKERPTSDNWIKSGYLYIGVRPQ